MSKGGGSIPGSPTDKEQAKILKGLEANVGVPVRQTIMPSALETLGGPGVYQTTLPASNREAIEAQFKQAQNSIMNSGTRGGQLQSRMADLARDRAATVSGATNQAKQVGIERALGLVPAAIPSAQSRLATGAQIGSTEQNRLNSQAQMEAQNQAGKGQGAASLVGTGMMAYALGF